MSQLPRVVIAPTWEPVSLAEMKGVLRVTSTDEDDFITSLIKGVRQALEKRTGRAFVEQTLEISHDAWPGYGDQTQYERPDYLAIELPRATPLVSVTSVSYRDTDEQTQIMEPADYIVDTDSMPGRIAPPFNGMWPTVVLSPLSPIKVRYVAGYVDESPAVGFPDEDVKQAIRLLVPHFFEHREAVVIGERSTVDPKALEMGVDMLCANLQLYGF